MEFTLSDIRRVLDAFDASDWDEIHISSGETTLRLAAIDVTPSASPASVVAAESSRVVAPPLTLRADPAVVALVAPTDVVAPQAVSGVAVAAPSVGVFYRAPGPEAPAFVEIGDVVRADTTVCILEVMKLMNPVLAGMTGTIVAVHAANAQQVKHGQALFTIAP
jgi:acetyl-CoA carboxylase biotin carboxyl carrier protein